MRHSARLFIAAMAVATAGCGGAVPGLSPMGNSLTDGLAGNARSQSSKGRQIALRSPWDVAALKNRVPKPKFAAEQTAQVGDKRVVARDVTFEVEPIAGSKLSLAGVLATPQRPANDKRRLPVLLLLGDRQSAASEEQARTWASRGYAALALDLPGKGEGREKARSTGPDWTDEALASASPTANPLHASVTAVIAAVSVMAAQPEVDARRIGLVGEGWGGVVASLAGAVDDRLQALVLERTAGGLERGALAEALKKLSPKEREAWTKAYDPDTYAKADHPPTLFVQPLTASEPSLAAVSATFRGRSGTKALALIPPDAKEAETVTVTTWLATRLLGETPLPEIRSVRAEGAGAVVRTGGQQPPRSVAVYYAVGELAKAEWKNVTGEKAGDGLWRCELPKPEEGQPLTVFAALTDARGAILCTEPGPLTAAAPAAKGQAVAARATRATRPAR
jgi:hypothetical protein